MPTHYKGSREETRALNAFINLIRCSDSLASRLGEELESYGLTPGQFGALETLYHLGPLCQHALAEKLLRSGGNVTLVVDNLEKRGWVRRVRLTEDRRMVKIHLTPEGKRLIARVFPQHLKALVAEMSRLSATEQENLRDICRKLGRVALPSADGQRKKADSEKEVRHDSGSTE